MKWFAKSDIGVVRADNQDRVLVLEKEGIILAIICDGMGGHLGGAQASSITIQTFKKEFKKFSKEPKLNQWFSNTLGKATLAMKKFAKKERSLLDMGTTLTAAIIFQKQIYIFNIGDSRAYAYNGFLHQLTKDHNLRNLYIDKFNYTPEEAAKVAGAMALTSALGPSKKSSVDTFILDRTHSLEYIVLTSDGVHDYLSKPQLEQILTNVSSLEKKVSEIIKTSIRMKSADNVSAIIVDVRKRDLCLKN